MPSNSGDFDLQKALRAGEFHDLCGIFNQRRAPLQVKLITRLEIQKQQCCIGIEQQVPKGVEQVVPFVVGNGDPVGTVYRDKARLPAAMVHVHAFIGRIRAIADIRGDQKRIRCLDQRDIGRFQNLVFLYRLRCLRDVTLCDLAQVDVFGTVAIALHDRDRERRLVECRNTPVHPGAAAI